MIEVEPCGCGVRCVLCGKDPFCRVLIGHRSGAILTTIVTCKPCAAGLGRALIDVSNDQFDRSVASKALEKAEYDESVEAFIGPKPNRLA